jgi:hypothetical protein
MYLKDSKATKERRELHNWALRNLYSSQTVISDTKFRTTETGHVACTGEKRNAYRNFCRYN